jgi:carbonic anhydrase
MIWHCSLRAVICFGVLAQTLALLCGAQATQEHSKGFAQSADATWNSLLAGNQRFVTGESAKRNLINDRRRLQKTQHPRAAVLSCSDSRVPPETIFDQGLGDLFVVRIAGNSDDPLGLGSLEYAVEHLGTNVIVVLGHQSCGAVTAACSREAMPSPSLEAVIRPIAESCTVAKTQGSADDLIEQAVKDHVRKTAHDLLVRSSILKHAYDAGRLAIIEAYYSLDTGTVTRLQ